MALDIISEGGGNEHPLIDCYRLWIQDGSQENTDVLVELVRYYEKEMGLGFFSFLRKSGLNMQKLIDLAEERFPKIRGINFLETILHHTAEEVTKIYKNDLQRNIIQSGPKIVLQNS